jgi:threonyl-tRNA synthetase
LKEAGFRAETLSPSDTLGARIRAAQAEKLPYMLVLGEKEKQADSVAVRARSGEQTVMKTEEFLEKLRAELKNKR